jgi:hypothetical protein
LRRQSKDKDKTKRKQKRKVGSKELYFSFFGRPKKIDRENPTTGKARKQVRMNSKIEYAKMNPSKLALIKKSVSTPHDMMGLLSFITLPMKDLQVICSFKGNDWMKYGDLKEYEYGANREAEDIPADVKDADEYKAILTQALYDKVNVRWSYGKNITYELYVKMRKAEGNDDDE